MTSYLIKNWRDYFLKNPTIEISNSLLQPIRDSVSPSTDFAESISEISKNAGITLLALDASEGNLQLIHHPTVLGGNWANKSKKIVAILGFEDDATPIKIIEKSIKESKGKTPSISKFEETMDDEQQLRNLKNLKTDYHYMNIIPLPQMLTKAFLELNSTDPLSVARAFFKVLNEADNKSTPPIDTDKTYTPPARDNNTMMGSNQDKDVYTDNEEEDNTLAHEVQSPTDDLISDKNSLTDFFHVIQFCFLCYKGKIHPVLYTVDKSPDTSNWFSTLRSNVITSSKTSNKRSKSKGYDSDPNDEIESPDYKISRKDQHFINTMLKINESVDKNILKKVEKEPGFSRLEQHKKNLILNASAIPPYDEQAPQPTDFLLQFMSKKNQFKAKEMLSHRLSLENIPFHPSTQMVSCLWNGDYMWLTPDYPSGISIFFCPELSTVNSFELEKDRSLALADKVKQGDIEKITKQKFHIPQNIMEMVWMTQNFQTIVSLCFGPKSHSALFLEDWAKHMYNNRLMYKSLLASDQTFFVQVLFSIDRALQIHWKSCCDNNSRESVNDRILMMQDKQDLIIQHNFTYRLPKVILDKFQESTDKKTGGLKGDKDKDLFPGKQDGKQEGKQEHKVKSMKDIVMNHDPAHLRWRIKDGENFSKTFYSNGKKCPKTEDGKMICMRFFVRGICEKSCTRCHKLSKDDEKAFDLFVNRCREGGASKPDF
jgi:hypothetical protein